MEEVQGTEAAAMMEAVLEDGDSEPVEVEAALVVVASQVVVAMATAADTATT
jgi:hypothetical protein